MATAERRTFFFTVCPFIGDVVVLQFSTHLRVETRSRGEPRDI
jgi:hypothetical protein